MLATIQVTACPGTQNDRLQCVNDYIEHHGVCGTSTYVTSYTDAECSINVRRVKTKKRKYFREYNASCKLNSFDVAKPALKRCKLVFNADRIFASDHLLSINLMCNPTNQSLINIFYKPACHVKLSSPGRPHINLTTVSWSPIDTNDDEVFTTCISQIQWKQEDQSWTNASVRDKESHCSWQETHLNPDSLVLGEKYEARVRVQAKADWSQSYWSDWSPIASWTSAIGKTKLSPSDGRGALKLDILGGTVGATVFALCLVIVLFRTDKTTWIYIVKKIRGPPLPDPRKSFLHDVNFKAWHTSNLFYSVWKLDSEVLSSEVTIMDGTTHCRPEAVPRDKMRCESHYESSSSSFCNPIYSHLCVPAVFHLMPGNLEPCPADTPYGPVGRQDNGKSEEEDMEEVRRKDVEILQLLSRGSGDSQPLEMCSDYKRVEKIEAERCGLQSPDSGMCSGEEVSQESLEEEDGVGVTTGQEEIAKSCRKELEFQKLLGKIGSGGSVQVCSDYEQVAKPEVMNPSLQSPDSGVVSAGEEQTSQDNLEDANGSTASTTFLFPSPSSTLPNPLLSFPALLLKSSGEGFTPPLNPCPKHILEMIGLNSATKPVEPSGDGYMPVRVEVN
ncbi:uncharacterized protein LOC117526834 isoform X2 [Thalassophryne amazonica]|uniref:uncharacterized protein LOC117526834 isoform X2 n=1 Tax=Thalassophryne amazonica TaxID=390379 RepID=UPI0014712EC5|nr:uncharacterized protein LOC117526834 isoform X2 [Thalassophryne amazonica]